jgi:hypothetical protein
VRKQLIDRAHPLPVCRQFKLVGISRSSAHYALSPVSAVDLALMRRIDELRLGGSICRRAYVNAPAQVRGHSGRTQTRHHLDAQNGHRGAVFFTDALLSHAELICQWMAREAGGTTFFYRTTRLENSG